MVHRASACVETEEEMRVHVGVNVKEGKKEGGERTERD